MGRTRERKCDEVVDVQPCNDSVYDSIKSKMASSAFVHDAALYNGKGLNGYEKLVGGLLDEQLRVVLAEMLGGDRWATLDVLIPGCGAGRDAHLF